jgi:galactose mutarotase-like enzyme
MEGWMSRAESKEALLSHVGRLSQLGGISSFVYADGPAKGTSGLRVRTASGLEFWVVPDRGMDIYEASFRGESLCWQSPSGLVHPSYYSSRGLEWLKSFAGGLLTTCGLTTVGMPSTDDGQELGLHGSISNTPAEHVAWTETWEKDDCHFQIKGRARETSVHGANLVLDRTISTSLKSKSLTIEDSVENQGVRDSPLMVLYHFNLGYPLLTPKSQIFAASRKVDPATSFAAETLDQWMMFDAPKRNQMERVYFHEMEKSADGWSTVVLVRDREQSDFGIALSYDTSTLPQFVQWKMTGENHFALGLEPSNCRTLGRQAERQRGTLQFLEPGQKRNFRLKIEVLDSAESVKKAIRSTGYQNGN